MVPGKLSPHTSHRVKKTNVCHNAPLYVQALPLDQCREHVTGLFEIQALMIPKCCIGRRRELLLACGAALLTAAALPSVSLAEIQELEPMAPLKGKDYGKTRIRSVVLCIPGRKLINLF